MELADAGFVTLDGRQFKGPLPASLRSFTDAAEMTLTINDPWPYRQPSIFVDGIGWWHAAHETPCLWQADDNTKRWITLTGILERIDEWADHAQSGFTTIEGAALDPHLYFESPVAFDIGLDIKGLVGNLDQEGQHGEIHLSHTDDALPEIRPGPSATECSGRWFYRNEALAPPKNGTDVEAALTDNQRQRLHRLLKRYGTTVIVLAWPTPHGTAALPLIVKDGPVDREYHVLRPVPISMSDRRRRAGPDAETLAAKRVVLFGVGAIGSHVASLLARSGIGTLEVVDGDIKEPAGLVRHAFPSAHVGKADEVRSALAAFDWTTVVPHPTHTWAVGTLEGLMHEADLCIDATGNTLFAELLSRLTLDATIPFLTVSLYRGGRVLRVRRQAEGDTPITARAGHWQYPPIPAAENPEADFLGAETGCAAAIHNAPPASVVAAATAATLTSIDLLTGRRHHADESIEVIDPIEAPFDHLGRRDPQPPPIMVTEEARGTILEAAKDTHPAETGGILIGARDPSGRRCIVRAVELRPANPSTHRYQVPAGVTQAAVDTARQADDRLEYLGEWHSHPTDQPASPTDLATMLALADSPDTGAPILLVVRPRSPEDLRLTAYETSRGSLMPVQLVDAGPLQPAKAEQ